MYDQEIVTIFDTIAMSMFGTELSPDGPRAEPLDAPALTACVDFDGSFEGCLRASFGAQLARRLAAMMLDQPPEALSEDDLCDAIGELVNIAAGNLKGILPVPCRLSLPRVHAGRPSPANRVAAVGRAAFRLFGEPVQVSLSSARAAVGTN